MCIYIYIHNYVMLTIVDRHLRRSQEPSCSELISELQMISAWMPALAMWDEDVDVDLTEGLGKPWGKQRGEKNIGSFLDGTFGKGVFRRFFVENILVVFGKLMDNSLSLKGVLWENLVMNFDEHVMAKLWRN